MAENLRKNDYRHGLSGNRIVGHVATAHTQVLRLLREMGEPMKAILYIV